MTAGTRVERAALRRALSVLPLLLASALSMAASARAEMPAAQGAGTGSGGGANGSSGWRVTLMPHVWASGLSGSVRPFAGAPTLSFSVGASDMLEDLDAAMFASFVAERGRVVVLGDLHSVSSSRAGTLPGGIPARGGVDQTTVSVAAGYRIRSDDRVSVDVFGGFRSLELEVDVSVFGGARSVSPSRSILDPLVGARTVVPLSPRWTGTLQVDVAGFGVGTESTVSASALFAWSLSDRVELAAGYRSMWVDYDDGPAADVTIGGPVLGVGFRF